MIGNELKGFRIMVVEDDEGLNFTISETLESHGAVVSQAKNGREALTLLEKGPVDLILSDMQMPVMNGLELLQKIREQNPDIPFFVVATGQTQVGEDTFYKSGANGIIYKPFNVKALLTHLKTLIESKKQA